MLTMVSKIMWTVLFFISCTCLLVNGFGNEEILGKGRWLVLSNLECENPEQYEIQLDITRRKLNRTHDAFSMHAEFNDEMNSSYGYEAIANKEVDGGYKLHTTLSDDSFCNTAEKYGGDNWRALLAKANVDPPECPIPKGPFAIDDFVLNYDELEETGMYGKYDVSLYFVYMGKRLACSRWLLQFEKRQDDDDDDDDDEDY